MVNPSKFMRDFKAFINLIADDEEIEKERFIDNGDIVTDISTGLMWTKDANLTGTYTSWQQALDYAKNLTLCGYSDWRLPTVKDLSSLVDYSQYNPALPEGHPFINAQSNPYWSSTTNAHNPDYAWIVNMWDGYVNNNDKSNYDYVWPVRSSKKM